ncbi:hypothetical protein HK100_002360 [Physocladia obscura]|uniref:Uncharacterized protein n=1 Tax=Physocladia obscura TaxID=109957 RepID=A0AAD5T7Y8_9FUNG|nr:hypothetical protein HK100_002360 [Physocladia obscura]
MGKESNKESAAAIEKDKRGMRKEATAKQNQARAEQSDDLRKRKAEDSMKRYSYLLGQTDLFGMPRNSLFLLFSRPD